MHTQKHTHTHTHGRTLIHGKQNEDTDTNLCMHLLSRALETRHKSYKVSNNCIKKQANAFLSPLIHSEKKKKKKKKKKGRSYGFILRTKTAQTTHCFSSTLTTADMKYELSVINFYHKTSQSCIFHRTKRANVIAPSTSVTYSGKTRTKSVRG